MASDRPPGAVRARDAAGTATAGSVVVRLPVALVRLFPGCPDRHAVAAATVGEAIDRLDDRWPGLRHRLCEGTPALRRHINVFVGGAPGRLDTPTPPGTEVIVLTAITGG